MGCADTNSCWYSFHSSYQIARMLAQPQLRFKDQAGLTNTLPRGELLLLGGDLAYPTPTAMSYETRFFRVFEDAMPPPSHYDAVSVDVAVASGHSSQLTFLCPVLLWWCSALLPPTSRPCQRAWPR